MKHKKVGHPIDAMDQPPAVHPSLFLKELGSFTFMNFKFP